MKSAGRSGGAAAGNLWKVDTAQTIGRRSEQQDAFGRCTIRLDDGEVAAVAVVADGMGGEVGGKLAADTAVAAFVAACQDGIASDVALRLRDALYASNAAVGGAVADDPRLDGMGCTLVALALGRGRAAWISVGDSLLLAWREGALERLNADHSMAPALEEAVRAGEMTAEQAAAHPQRSILLSALTGRGLALVDEKSLALPAADRFILATDGLLSLGRDEMAQILSGAEPKELPGGLAEALVQAIEKKGYADQDNCTVLVVTPSGARARRRSRWPGFILMAAGLGLLAVPLLLWRQPPRAPVPSNRPAPAARTLPPAARVVPPSTPPKPAVKPKPKPARNPRQSAKPVVVPAPAASASAAPAPATPAPAPAAAGPKTCGAHPCSSEAPPPAHTGPTRPPPTVRR
ncbi:MAG: family protein phosphatase [Sphingomonadales bacterium]|nr:family protein phosphatase [Sphingomonadales bacterium]